MKASKNELDVDFIGGQGALTKEEEMAITEFIKSKKSFSKKSLIKVKTHEVLKTS